MYYWAGKKGEYLHVLGKAIPPLVDKRTPDPKSAIKKGYLSKESIKAFKEDGRIVSLKAKPQAGANDEAQQKLDEEEAKKKAAEEAAAAADGEDEDEGGASSPVQTSSTGGGKGGGK